MYKIYIKIAARYVSVSVLVPKCDRQTPSKARH